MPVSKLDLCKATPSVLAGCRQGRRGSRPKPGFGGSQAAWQGKSRRRSRDRGGLAMPGGSRDREKGEAPVQRVTRTRVKAPANMGVFRGTELPSRAGVVRVVAGADHWHRVCPPRWICTTWNAASTCHRRRCQATIGDGRQALVLGNRTGATEMMRSPVSGSVSGRNSPLRALSPPAAG